MQNKLTTKKINEVASYRVSTELGYALIKEIRNLYANHFLDPENITKINSPSLGLCMRAMTENHKNYNTIPREYREIKEVKILKDIVQNNDTQISLNFRTYLETGNEIERHKYLNMAIDELDNSVPSLLIGSILTSICEFNNKGIIDRLIDKFTKTPSLINQFIECGLCPNIAYKDILSTKTYDELLEIVKLDASWEWAYIVLCFPQVVKDLNIFRKIGYEAIKQNGNIFSILQLLISDEKAKKSFEDDLVNLTEENPNILEYMYWWNMDSAKYGNYGRYYIPDERFLKSMIKFMKLNPNKTYMIPKKYHNKVISVVKR